MLIRVIVGNLYSFQEKTEFNMLTGDVRRHSHHVHKLGKVEVLRTAAIYGANGAGKSNLVKSLNLLQIATTSEKIPSEKIRSFKLSQSKELPYSHIEIEIFLNKKNYLYGVSLTPARVAEEWLYEVGEGKKDVLIFERKTNENEETKISFSPKYENNAKAKLRRELYESEILKPETTMLWQLNQAKNSLIKEAKEVLNWLENKLLTIYPNSAHKAFVEAYITSNEFKNFCDTLISKFNTGVFGLHIKKTLLDNADANQQDLLKLKNSMIEKGITMVSFLDRNRHPFTLTRLDEQVYLNEVQTLHNNLSSESVVFDIIEESDGTRRLMDLIVAFYTYVKFDITILIDEIERSIHPALIKTILQKIIGEEQAKGQLIFTTHESNLLDLEMLRQDEIWFAEKNEAGATAFYSLNDYSIRPDLDIEKGYLMGRFGAIPMLNDLKKLKWQEQAHAEN